MAYNNPNPPRDYTRPVGGGATRRTQPALPIGGATSSTQPASPTGGVNPFAAKRMQSRYDGDASAYVNDALLPYWERARNEMRSSLADQGMLSSSAGMNRYSQDVEQPYAQAANTMYRDYINQRRSEDFTRRITADQEARAAQQQEWSQDFAGIQERRAAQQQEWSQGFQTNQANAQNTMNLYNLLWSSYLQGYGLGGDELANLIGRPNQFPMWADIYKLGYQQPSYSPWSQNMGDPVSDQKQTDYVPMIRDTPPSLQQKQMEADNAYRNAYLNYLKSTGGGGGGGVGGASDDDKWAMMADEAAANRLNGLDETPGDNYYPTQMLEIFKAKYGVDIPALVAQGDGRAEALVRSMYGDPAYADRVIARMKGEVSTKVPWRDFHTESGTPMPETKNYYSYHGAFPFPSK